VLYENRLRERPQSQRMQDNRPVPVRERGGLLRELSASTVANRGVGVA